MAPELAAKEVRLDVGGPCREFGQVTPDIEPSSASNQIDHVCMIGEHLIAEETAEQDATSGTLCGSSDVEIRCRCLSRTVELRNGAVDVIEIVILRNSQLRDWKVVPSLDFLEEAALVGWSAGGKRHRHPVQRKPQRLAALQLRRLTEDRRRVETAAHRDGYAASAAEPATH